PWVVASASPSPSPAPAGRPPAATATPAGAERTYTVEAGDTLGSIAQKMYGDSSQWRKIYDANRSAIGDNPDAVKIGTQLRIPPN
ncbi:MAG: LysM peptidoglycan-binding domain-containing protein, partial [Chloroflexi bacterium]|nr:LysM peptidoglycan-binding domain-containing protein [Chloroflexota bacterium]